MYHASMLNVQYDQAKSGLFGNCQYSRVRICEHENVGRISF